MDSTDAFTLGALKNAPGGNGVRLLHLAGQLSGLDGTGTYTVSPEGAVVGSGGGADGDLVMTDGAGCIVTVTAYDVDATGVAPEGAVATVNSRLEALWAQELPMGHFNSLVASFLAASTLAEEPRLIT